LGELSPLLPTINGRFDRVYEKRKVRPYALKWQLIFVEGVAA